MELLKSEGKPSKEGKGASQLSMWASPASLPSPWLRIHGQGSPTLLAPSPSSEQIRNPETEETFYLLLLWRPLELLSEQLSLRAGMAAIRFLFKQSVVEAILGKECNSCKSNFCLGKCCSQQWHKLKWEKKVLSLEWHENSKGCTSAPCLWSPRDHSTAHRAGELPWAMEVTSHPKNTTEHPTSLSCLIVQADYLPFFPAFLSWRLFPDFLSPAMKQNFQFLHQCFGSEGFTPCTMDHFQSCW